MIDISVIPEAIESLINEGSNPGRIITNQWIDKALKLNKSDIDYQWKRLSRFEEFRARLLQENKIDLKNIRGQGYMIIAPEAQTKVAVDDTMRGIARTIQKGQTRVANVDVAKLSDDARKENADAMARLAGLGSMTKKQIAG